MGYLFATYRLRYFYDVWAGQCLTTWQYSNVAPCEDFTTFCIMAARVFKSLLVDDDSLFAKFSLELMRQQDASTVKFHPIEVGEVSTVHSGRFKFSLPCSESLMQ